MKFENVIWNEDCLNGVDKIPDNSIDLLLADPPYCLGKDYGNNSDKMDADEYLEWSYQWIDAFIPKIKDTGSFYIFLSWQFSPEIFSQTSYAMIFILIWTFLHTGWQNEFLVTFPQLRFSNRLLRFCMPNLLFFIDS